MVVTSLVMGETSLVMVTTSSKGDGGDLLSGGGELICDGGDLIDDSGHQNVISTLCKVMVATFLMMLVNSLVMVATTMSSRRFVRAQRR